VRIRILPVRSRCHFTFPILTQGGICVGEEYCRLPANHSGPHLGGNGASAVNAEDAQKILDPVRRR